MCLLHAADLKVGGGEPLAEPGAAGEGVVGGEAIADDGGLGDADGGGADVVPAVALANAKSLSHLIDAYKSAYGVIVMAESTAPGLILM